MMKLLSVGFILVLCGSLIGCSNEFDKDKISECKEMEEDILYYEDVTNRILTLVVERSNDIFDMESQDDIDYEFECTRLNEKKLNEYCKELSDISLKKLEEYHNFMVEYSGTTQEEQDIEYSVVKLNYLQALRNISYATEICSYYEDGEMTQEELEVINNINEIRSTYLDKAISSESDYDLQSQLDKKYNMDTNEMIELRKRIDDYDYSDDNTYDDYDYNDDYSDSDY